MNSNVTREEIILTLRETFLKDLGVRIEDNDLDFFQTHTVDSLAFLNAIARLEKLYHIRLPNEEIPLYSSFHKLADGILAHRPQGILS